ncbi:AraC family transcriptional regulator [Streptomyces sp. NPDC047000]|uniref:AraC family transcriptional regulator n=1 Tax=Streptomyces sp. NPDC047000 TaxID=3155474 RepID=UPI0034012E25
MDVLDDLRDLVPRLCKETLPGSRLPGSIVVTSNEESRPYCSEFDPMVALVIAGEKRTMLPGREFVCGPGDYLVYSLELMVTAQVTRADPFIAVGVLLRPELIAELLLEAPDLSVPAGSGLGLGQAPADRDLLGAMLRLLRLNNRPRDFAILAAGIERELHWLLLTGPLGGLVRQVGRSDTRYMTARRAARWIDDHFDRPMRVEDLAQHVGVSVPTLNRYFREVTTMSPVQYQKQLRLQRARIRLIAAPDDVAEAGHSVGYESLSQFSREYRRLFGVPPGEDARNARLSASPPGPADPR